MTVKRVCALWIIAMVLAVLLVNVHGLPYADDFPYHVYRPSTLPAGPSAERQVMLKITGSTSTAKDSGIESASNTRDNRKDEAFGETGSINSAKDAVRYHQLDNHLDGHRLLDASKGSTVDKMKHLSGENFETDKSHNRKYIKSGFSNSYHKDENGSKSSYYEDSDDRGGKQVYDNRHNFRNDHLDKLYNQERRNDYLRDHYDDKRGGTDAQDTHNFHRAAALNRGNMYGYRDGYMLGDHNDQRRGTMTAYGAYDYYQPASYQPYHRQSYYYEPRPSFPITPIQSAPITIYDDLREFRPYVASNYYRTQHYMTPREIREDTRSGDYLQDFGERRRLVYKDSPPQSVPYGYQRYQ
ncbi:uncharacterized protein LOC118464964 [Anopheles albimanus]|uniref:uncharacterized protein LOC118464964 n=1 Tax=Anopheles albimanus TaxID=7167 RepID=UPI00163EB078|nr:uncharacterized protein LOC118464964 [Anopheles albimanus]